MPMHGTRWMGWEYRHHRTSLGSLHRWQEAGLVRRVLRGIGHEFLVCVCGLVVVFCVPRESASPPDDADFDTKF